MSRASEEPLLATHCFRVFVRRRELGFASVSGLTSLTELEAPDGEHRHRFEPVVLRRALSDSRELYEWRRRIAAGRSDKRPVTIEQLVRPGGPVVNAWRLVDAWPVRWSGPSFDALQPGIAWEELELVYADLLWLEKGD
jgi:phage tail-like protein